MAINSKKTSTLLDRVLFFCCLLMPILILYWATSSGLIFANERIWHEKMTVVVNTPQGKVEASSVHRTGFSPPGFSVASSRGTFLQGEAIVVELPDKNGKPRYLFALLKSFSSYYLFHRKAFRAGDKYPKDFLGKPPRALPVKSYPLLVIFEDVQKPETVKQVKPEEFEAVFGEGYSLEEITVQITDEEVSDKWMKQLMLWFNGYHGHGLCKATGLTENIPFCRRVKYGNLIRKKS